MKNLKLLFVSLLIGLFLSPGTGFSLTNYSSSDYYGDDPLTKLFRGFANIVESPAELGCHTREAYYETPMEATGSFLKGFVMAARRAILGVIDIATFIFPGDSNLHPVCSHSKYYANPI